MTHLQKTPRKPLFDEKQGEIFILHLDEILEKKIAQLIFVEGATNEEVAEEIGYSKRQIERIRISLMKTVLKRLVEKQIPKKVIVKKYDIGGNDYFCPCGNQIKSGQYCPDCGQALLWESEADAE